MKAVAAAITLASVISSVMAQGTLIINTPPSLVECQPAAISFSGGTAPYFISVLPGGESGGTPLEQFPQQATAGSLTWNPVDIAAGTSITLEIRDNTGATNFSSPVTIVAGTSDACLAAGAASGTSASAASTPAALPSAASSAASSASSVAASAVSAASSAASSASSRVFSASSAASSAKSSSSSTSSTAPAATTSSTSGASTVSAGFSVVLAAGVAGILRALLA